MDRRRRPRRGRHVPVRQEAQLSTDLGATVLDRVRPLGGRVDVPGAGGHIVDLPRGLPVHLGAAVWLADVDCVCQLVPFSVRVFCDCKIMLSSPFLLHFIVYDKILMEKSLEEHVHVSCNSCVDGHPRCKLVPALAPCTGGFVFSRFASPA